MKTLSPLFFSRATKSHELVNNWLGEHIDCFSPIDEKNTHRHNFRFKALAELCLYAHLWKKLNFNGEIPIEIIEPVQGIVQNSSFLNLLLARPVDTVSSIGCILPFPDSNIYGILSKYYKDICQPFNNEMLPFDTLSHVYIHDAMNLFDDKIADIEQRAISLSALCLPPNGIASLSLGAYPLTHTVFYASRFGTKPIKLDASNSWKIERNLNIEISKAYHNHNIDVALELVLARICLFNRMSDADYMILSSAMALVEETGFLVALPHEGEKLFTDNRERTWSKQYHSMLVLGILLGKILADFNDIKVNILDSEDVAHLEQVALSMDAVGAIFAAVESGNLPLAVLLYSRLEDIPSKYRPTDSVLGHFCSYVEQIYGLFSQGVRDESLTFGQGANVWSMSTDEFMKTMEIFSRARKYALLQNS